MKKLIVLLIVLLPTMCWGVDSVCKSSGRQDADILISAVPSQLCGVVIETNASDDATVVVWDSKTAAAGTAKTDDIFKMIVVGANYSGQVMFPNPIRATKGIYIDVDGTAAAYTIYYRAQ